MHTRIIRGVVLDLLQLLTHPPRPSVIFSISRIHYERRAVRHSISKKACGVPHNQVKACGVPLNQVKACGAPLIQQRGVRCATHPAERRAVRHSSSREACGVPLIQQRGVRRATHPGREARGGAPRQNPAAEPTTRRGKLHAVAAKGSTRGPDAQTAPLIDTRVAVRVS